jgi:hypothetical protein
VRCMTLSVAISMVVASGLLLLPVGAAADPGATTKKGCVGAMCFVVGKASGDEARAGSTRSPDKGPRQDPANSGYDQKVREAGKKLAAAIDAYNRRVVSYNRCVRTFDPSRNSAGCGSAPTLPTVPRFASATFSGRGSQPIRVTADQAAAMAVARLQLPTIAPGIGPSPDLNPWNMAAVGYPLWLWADGPTHVRVRSKHENCHGESRHLRQDLV